MPLKRRRQWNMEPTSSGNDRGHETTDAGLKAAGLLMLMMLGFVVVGVVSMYFLYGVVIEYQASKDTPPSPLEDSRVPFTGPRLQVAPPMDMDEMEAAESEVLESYDWVDRDAGIVRIPIDRAIELLAERGLPKTQTPSASEQE
jgi:hypothetical protein